MNIHTISRPFPTPSAPRAYLPSTAPCPAGRPAGVGAKATEIPNFRTDRAAVQVSRSRPSRAPQVQSLAAVRSTVVTAEGSTAPAQAGVGRRRRASGTTFGAPVPSTRPLLARSGVCQYETRRGFVERPIAAPAGIGRSSFSEFSRTSSKSACSPSHSHFRHEVTS
jgi:hypothetical protein